MKRNFTLLSLVLFITTMVFAQQTNFEQHDFLKNVKSPFQKDFKFNHLLDAKLHALSGNSYFKYPKNNLKETFTEKESLDSIVGYDFDDGSGQWIKYLKVEYTYNTNGYLIEEIECGWDETSNQWKNCMKSELTYDENGYLTEELDYERNDSLGQWIKFAKWEYVYNSNGDETELFIYVWDENTSQWAKFWKREISYDENGNPTEAIMYHWNKNTNQWLYASKYEYSYDENGNQILITYFIRDEEKDQWTYLTVSWGKQAYLATYLSNPEEVRQNSTIVGIGHRHWLNNTFGLIGELEYMRLQNSYNKYRISVGVFIDF